MLVRLNLKKTTTIIEDVLIVKCPDGKYVNLHLLYNASKEYRINFELNFDSSNGAYV